MRMVMERLNIERRKPRSGDRCQCAKCRGHIKVVNTEAKEDLGYRVQYLGCDTCHMRPDDNKVIVPLEFAPPRRKN